MPPQRKTKMKSGRTDRSERHERERADRLGVRLAAGKILTVHSAEGVITYSRDMRMRGAAALELLSYG